MIFANIVGARPQFIKAAVVSRSLQMRENVREVLIHTGQHYDEELSDVFFRDLAIPKPAHWLGIGSGTHGRQTAAMLEGIERVLRQERPDCVIVYGDTNSTLAGAIATAKLRIPLAHVEAGLRSFNREMPEEINRVLTDHSSDFLFAPTTAAVDNLYREGLKDGVYLTGDVMYDAALQYASVAESTSRILQQLKLTSKEYVLATIHRAENTDSAERLQTIVSAFEEIAKTIPVVFPVHPRTRHASCMLGVPLNADEVQFIDPLGFLDMTMLERHARLIVTDSGGVQKEAFFHGVQCVTVRGETEWVELLGLGWNRLAPAVDTRTVVAGVEAALVSDRGADVHPYGDGRSAEHIVDVLLTCCEDRRQPVSSMT